MEVHTEAVEATAMVVVVQMACIWEVARIQAQDMVRLQVKVKDIALALPHMFLRHQAAARLCVSVRLAFQESTARTVTLAHLAHVLTEDNVHHKADHLSVNVHQVFRVKSTT